MVLTARLTSSSPSSSSDTQFPLGGEPPIQITHSFIPWEFRVKTHKNWWHFMGSEGQQTQNQINNNEMTKIQNGHWSKSKCKWAGQGTKEVGFILFYWVKSLGASGWWPSETPKISSNFLVTFTPPTCSIHGFRGGGVGEGGNLENSDWFYGEILEVEKWIKNLKFYEKSKVLWSQKCFHKARGSQSHSRHSSAFHSPYSSFVSFHFRKGWRGKNWYIGWMCN